ncbi:hypothetical protein QOZ80_5AG0383220 [Eleusine coracana subsp. coracana]|nr:hypothetical protein QOZ80_5AG0383220 [Eleusine coracana subsp. coracana]
MRSGGRRGGRGRGGGREGGGGYDRRDVRPGGAASRDDRDRRDRRPDYSPRRRADDIPRRRIDHSPRRRSPSPPPRARRPRGEDGDREATRGNRGPTRGGRVGYGGDRVRPRGCQMGYGGDRSPPPGRGDSSYDEHSRGRKGNYSGDRDLPRGPVSYGGDRDRPAGRGDLGYDDLHAEPGRRCREEDYVSDRDLPRQGRREDYSDLPHHGRREDYYHQVHDRGASETYNAPPAYMLPDHPSDLSRPSLHSGRKESDYFGGPSDRSLNRHSDYVGSPGRRYIDKERELLGDDGMTLRISATESGRTTALYQEHRLSPPRAALSTPPPLYPSVPPTGTGFLSGESDMMAGDGFGTGSTRLVRDGSRFEYGDRLPGPYAERGRGNVRNYSGNRDVIAEENGGTDSLYPTAEMPIHGDRETDRIYSSRGMLGSDLVGTQLKQIGDSSSSLLSKDRQYRMHSEPDFEPSNGYEMNGLGMPPDESLARGRVRAHRFSGRSLEDGSDHGDEALLNITRQEFSRLAPRAERMEYDGHGYVTRDPIIDTYVASEDLRGNVSQNPRHISGSGPLTGLKDERMNHNLRLSHRLEEDEDSYQGILHDSEHNRRDSYGIHASVPYPPARGGSDHYSRSPRFEPVGNARRPARLHDFDSFEDGRDVSDREASPMISRKRYRSPLSHDHEMDMCQADDEFAGRGYYNMVECDLSPRRMSRIYDMVDEDEDDPKYGMPSNHNVFSRLALPHEISGEWTDAEQEGHPHSSTLAYGYSKHKPISQRLSRPVGHSKFGVPSMQGRGKGALTKSEKKRMRVARHHFDGGSSRNEFIRLNNKYPKSSEDDNPNEAEMNHEDTPESEDLPQQKDPPEGSEEFTKQVHEAFLKYTKIINESPAMQKKFRDASKGSLQCCACGSVARKFPDVDALVSHAYDTCKMAEEVNAMKGDLLLWPPVVVVHNSSIAIKTKDAEFKIVSKEEIEGLLADIGIPLQKAKVSHGRPGNQSVFLVKFQPTISGFQEAMRIHDHFSAKNHGKEEFQEMSGSKGKQVAPIDNLDELLYAHIALAEDLGYLDDGTKRRSVIRSKVDIEAKAEATLNLEP